VFGAIGIGVIVVMSVSSMESVSQPVIVFGAGGWFLVVLFVREMVSSRRFVMVRLIVSY